MCKQFAAQDITVIASNSEKYISFQVANLRFIDSLQFLSESLDSLVGNLKKDGDEKFIHTRRHFPDERFELVTRKGVYPYEWMSDSSKFLACSLPPKDDFYSSLSESSISDDDYAHAQRVWRAFRMDTLQQYHDLYLTTDVLLLADVFEEFRRMALDHYKLDPAHFMTAPGLSFQACLKMTGVRLELFTNIDQLLFVEKGIRGGTSYIANRLGVGNNDYVGRDVTMPTTHIAYLDANNLYGWAMSQPLPTGEFRFWSDEQVASLTERQILNRSVDADKGLILEVDLVYPYRLHDDHNDYPLAVERVELSPEMLSPVAAELLGQLGHKYVKCEQTCPELVQQEPVRGSLPKPPILSETRSEARQDSSCVVV